MQEEALLAAGWRKVDSDGFIELVGPFWFRSDQPDFRMAFVAEAKHRNRRGVVQGGMLATLADRAMGQAGRLANGDRPQATIQLDLHYIDAVQLGEFVEAHCGVVRRTRSIIFIEAEILADQRLVAKANGIWKVLGDAARADYPPVSKLSRRQLT
jgi:uncharacterized protein (TIGR00369 family)